MGTNEMFDLISFSRPSGTIIFYPPEFPALKCRAIFIASLWDDAWNGGD
jgi:hypothetical protein